MLNTVQGERADKSIKKKVQDIRQYPAIIAAQETAKQAQFNQDVANTDPNLVYDPNNPMANETQGAVLLRRRQAANALRYGFLSTIAAMRNRGTAPQVRATVPGALSYNSGTGAGSGKGRYA